VQTLIDSLVSWIGEAGGALAYGEILAKISDADKRHLRGALQEGKRQKKFHADISVTPDGVAHVYKLGERPQS
jgi:hypothetical protein